MRNLLAGRPDLSRERFERTRELMDRNVRDCLVTGLEPLIGAVELPDPDDRGRADLILTFNLRAFPERCLAPYNVEARHPDEFVVGLLGRDERRVCAAVRTCRERLRHAPLTTEEHLDRLVAQGPPETVSWLRDRGDRL